MDPEDKIYFAVFVSIKGLPLLVVRLENGGLFWRGAKFIPEEGVVIEVCHIPKLTPNAYIKIDYSYPTFEWKNKFNFELEGKTKVSIPTKLPDLEGNSRFDDCVVKIYANRPPIVDTDKEPHNAKRDV